MGNINLINLEKLANYISSLYNEDGSVQGDESGETDIRFVYCYLSSLTILNRRELIKEEKILEYVLKCNNFDGSFGGWYIINN